MVSVSSNKSLDVVAQQVVFKTTQWRKHCIIILNIIFIIIINDQVFKMGSAQPEVALELVVVQQHLLQEMVELLKLLLPLSAAPRTNVGV